VDQELLQRRFEEAIAADAWVVEGMHRDQLYRALEDADAFVWLDYPKLVVAWRLTRRLLGQFILRTERHGRRTSVASAWERDVPFIRKAIRNHERRRQHGTALAERARVLGLEVERITSPRRAQQLLSS
jgi:adenylate kinase family enzyme